MSSDNDSVELALFEVRVGHRQNRFILPLRSNFESSFGGINVHVTSPFFEIDSRKEFLVTLFVNYVYLPNIGGSLNDSHLGLVGWRRSYVVIDNGHCGLVVSAWHYNDRVVPATTYAFTILSHWFSFVLTG